MKQCQIVNEYSTAQKQANHRTRFKRRANAFAFGTKRVCVGIQMQTQQNAFVKLISRSHFKIILHNRRLNKADFFVGRSLLLIIPCRNSETSIFEGLFSYDDVKKN